ncbi:LRMDA protein, partial [Acromyrmex charruanus]
MFHKCQTMNPLLNLEIFDWKQVTLDMLNDIPQYVHANVLEVTTYRIELRKDKEFVKLRFSLDLLKGTPQQFWESVTMPFCSSSMELIRRHKILLNLIKQKDEEIAEYKAEGAELIRKYIATKPFNEELFHTDAAGSTNFVNTFQSVIRFYNEITLLKSHTKLEVSSNNASSTNDSKIDGNVPLDSSKNDSTHKLKQDELNKQGPSKVEEYKANLSSKASLLKISSTSHTIRVIYIINCAIILGAWHMFNMAGHSQQDFNRSALTLDSGRAWYTGQRAEKIPNGLIRVIGRDCLGLDLSYNELSTISGIKDFEQLQELILDNNKLDNLKTLPHMPTLTTLSLNNNKIFNIDKALDRIRECCPNVEYVSLLGNPGCPDQLTNPTFTDEDDYERYRLYAIHILPPSLRFLDSRRVTQQERSNANTRGRYSKTIKLIPELIRKYVPSSTQTNNEFDDIYFNIHYTPLPSSVRNPQDHKGVYGKCKYRYSGKNSEGNRFISNNDL